MNQFKDMFLGLEKRDYSRAATSQKCVRAGGSITISKTSATLAATILSSKCSGIFRSATISKPKPSVRLGPDHQGLRPPQRQALRHVFREDDDAEALWQKVAGVPKDRIFRLDEKDNFWQMGDTGPCGPCSEIYYDFGPEAAEPGREHEQFPLDGGGRFVEIWNLVFMQYDRDSSGAFTPLPRPSIDTGMGLERMAAVLQGKLSNYDTDLLLPIVDTAANSAASTYGADPSRTALRIAADHARATAFLIHDGVMPSNEGRGYVLRKIMRRAMRNTRLIGNRGAFLYKLTGFVAEMMKSAYPEMLESVQRVARVVKEEEHRYATTFLVAERSSTRNQIAAARDSRRLSFKLYDTYGLASTSRKKWRASTASPSTATVSTPK